MKNGNSSLDFADESCSGAEAQTPPTKNQLGSSHGSPPAPWCDSLLRLAVQKGLTSSGADGSPLVSPVSSSPFEAEERRQRANHEASAQASAFVEESRRRLQAATARGVSLMKRSADASELSAALEEWLIEGGKQHATLEAAVGACVAAVNASVAREAHADADRRACAAAFERHVASETRRERENDARQLKLLEEVEQLRRRVDEMEVEAQRSEVEREAERKAAAEAAMREVDTAARREVEAARKEAAESVAAERAERARMEAAFKAGLKAEVERARAVHAETVAAHAQALEQARALAEEAEGREAQAWRATLLLKEEEHAAAMGSVEAALADAHAQLVAMRSARLTANERAEAATRDAAESKARAEAALGDAVSAHAEREREWAAQARRYEHEVTLARQRAAAATASERQLRGRVAAAVAETQAARTDASEARRAAAAAETAVARLQEDNNAALERVAHERSGRRTAEQRERAAAAAAAAAHAEAQEARRQAAAHELRLAEGDGRVRVHETSFAEQLAQRECFWRAQSERWKVEEERLKRRAAEAKEEAAAANKKLAAATAALVREREREATRLELTQQVERARTAALEAEVESLRSQLLLRAAHGSTCGVQPHAQPMTVQQTHAQRGTTPRRRADAPEYTPNAAQTFASEINHTWQEEPSGKCHEKSARCI